MLSLLVCRHGETDYNLQGRYAGSSDVPLNPKGREQASELSKNPLLTGVDFIVSSPLIRAVQTAVIIQKEIDKPLHIVPEFAERSLGVYEGLTRDEAKNRYPKLWEMNCVRLENSAPDGGETLVEFTRRIIRGIDCLKTTYRGRKVLLVSHGYAAREINRIYNGLRYDEMHGFTLGNAEMAEFCFQA